jgi:hypothetical protein
MDWQTLWNWLSDPDNRATLGWLGAGFVAFIIAVISASRRSTVVKADHGSNAAGRDIHQADRSRFK